MSKKNRNRKRKQRIIQYKDNDSNSNSSSKKNKSGEKMTVYSGNMKPKVVCYLDDKSKSKKSSNPKRIYLYGSAKINLDDFLSADKKSLSSGDLIINCTGDAYINKIYVKKSPLWFNPVDIAGPDQIVFDWKDFGVPPSNYQLSFWQELLAQIRKKNIQNVIVCCGAGLGRTGTCLASLLVAHGLKPEDAINFVREKYTMSAIENTQQENYILGLVYKTKEEINEAAKLIVKKPVTTSNSYQGSSYNGGSYQGSSYNGYQGTNYSSEKKDTSKSESNKDSKYDSEYFYMD